MSHYGTLAAADEYHAARGRAEWVGASEPDRAAALVRGSDYVDQRYATAGCGATFPGTRTGGRNQERAWPRTGAQDRDGNAIPPDQVPAEVERAAYEAAYRELLNPGSLSPDYVPAQQVTREKVGPIEVSYAGSQDGSGSRPVIPVIDEILAGLLFRPCGIGVRVV
ncbi:DnaT-like ssDNA-binding protein [Coralloluteibacterium thermophilus]|uniref:DnaT-like ssDNA-binding protein n=1 Tax=Coralloluteibacterium thermophilum TaxID=2707049 RepID=A0ABV9NL80_9GAMM